jgi:signal transduction histidine kinase
LPYALTLLTTAALAAGLALYTYGRRGERPGASTFAGLLVALTWLAATTAFQMLSPALSGKVLAETLKFAGTAALSPLWLAFALRYTRRTHWLTMRNRSLLALPGLVSVSLAATNPLHHLVWRGFQIDPLSPGLVVEGFGPVFWVFNLFHYGFILLAALIYALAYVPAAPVFRRQIGVMVAGALIPLLGHTIYLSGLYPLPGLDLTPFTFAISAVLLATGLFRYSLLDLQPIAARVVMNHLDDGVVVLDQEDRVVDLNPAARQLLGVTEAAIGQPAPPALRPAAGVEAQAIQIGQEEPRRWYRLTVSGLRDLNQHPVGRVVVLRDVTDEHLLQRLRGDLTHMLVHDLSNPLSAMHMALEMVHIQDNGPGQPPTVGPDAHEALEIVRRSNLRAQRLIASLLDISRLESGHMPVNRQPVNAVDLASGVARDLRPLADERGLALGLRLPDNLPAVLADPDLLDRVLRNLLSNAIKFTPRGGEATLTAAAGASEVTFTVSDNGNGLPDSVRARLFEKFVRGTSSPHGHGLGLAFCKLAVDTMGGHIWADGGAPGDAGVGAGAPRGAAFHFTLPRA